MQFRPVAVYEWAKSVNGAWNDSSAIPPDFLTYMEGLQKKYGHRVGKVYQIAQYPDCIIIDRTTAYGNPFPLKYRTIAGRPRSLYQYYHWLNAQIINDGPTLKRADIALLTHSYVLCHCNEFSAISNPNHWCHGMVLLAAADYVKLKYGC